MGCGHHQEANQRAVPPAYLLTPPDSRIGWTIERPTATATEDYLRWIVIAIAPRFQVVSVACCSTVRIQYARREQVQVHMPLSLVCPRAAGGAWVASVPPIMHQRMHVCY